MRPGNRVTLGVVYGVPTHISTEQLAAENHCQWARCITQQVNTARATEAHSTSTTDQVDVYTALLAFTADRPQSITVMDFLKLKVHDYLPRPRRCNNCWAFGHLGKHCKNAPVCEHCGLRGHNKASCRTAEDPTKKKCVNCKGRA